MPSVDKSSIQLSLDTFHDLPLFTTSIIFVSIKLVPHISVIQVQSWMMLLVAIVTGQKTKGGIASFSHREGYGAFGGEFSPPFFSRSSMQILSNVPTTVLTRNMVGFETQRTDVRRLNVVGTTCEYQRRANSSRDGFGLVNPEGKA